MDGSLSGRENLDLHARLWGVPHAQAAAQDRRAGRRVGLSELIDRPVSSYSGGQRRRLEIARALVSTPRVLFLDEPTVGLDPRIRHELLDVIAGLRAREEMTILVTTHYLDEAERLCDRVAIIHLGQIVALDSPARAARRARHRDPRVPRRAATRRRRSPSCARPASPGRRLRRRRTDHRPAARPRRRRCAGRHRRRPAALSEIATRVPTLDDVYLHRTGAQFAGAA